MKKDPPNAAGPRLGFEGPPAPGSGRRLRPPRARSTTGRPSTMIPLEAVVKRPTEPVAPSRDVSQIAEAEVSALAEAEAPRPITRTLRRDESVIAEAVKLRGTPGQRLSSGFHKVVGKPWAGLKRSFARGTVARDGAQAFSRLSPGQRAALIATPFLLTIVVAAWALWRTPAPLPVASAPRPITAPPGTPAKVIVSNTLGSAPSSAPPAAGAAPAAAPAAAPPSTLSAEAAAALPAAIAPALDPPAPTPVARATDASALDRLRQTGAPPIPLTVSEVVRTLPARASLYAAPKKSAPRTVSLPAGAEVLTYPGVPVTEGWLVARKPLGEIGFLRVSALQPKPAKAVALGDDAGAPAPAPRARKRAAAGLDEDRPLRATFGEERSRDEVRGSRRRADADDGAAAGAVKRRPAASAKPKRGASGKPLTADDLLLR